MKVIEKGADRTADAHLYLEGRVTPLEEYGQYIDASDKAICCYVATEEGHKFRIDCRFSGMTLVVASDVLIDGVCRKAHSYAGKSVQIQKKKFEFEKFLYQTPDGVIDTGISVAPYSGPLSLDKQAAETIGTIELRLYITRQFDVEHDVDVTCKYDEVHEHANASATYKDVPPHFHVTSEKNCSTLDASKGNREKKRVYAKRPGTEPWAIFRFHYRTKQSIVDQKMELTFDPTDKTYAKKEAHALDLELVPMLLLGSKPAAKNDGEISVRTSSPPLPDTPSTPNKASKKSKSTQVREPKTVTKKATELLGQDADADVAAKSNEIFANIMNKVAGKKDPAPADLIPPTLPVEVSSVPTVPHPADMPSILDPSTVSSPMAIIQPTGVSNTKDLFKSGTKTFTSPLKKMSAKPASIDTTLSLDLQKPGIPPTPPTPTKRPPEGTLTPPPDVKRIKTDTVPLLSPAHLPRSLSASPVPRTLSIEAQVTEQRKLLEATRKKRAEMSKKKAMLDERMAPYKQRIAEELERLRQEMAEEEAIMAEEEEDYKASEIMLAEFER
ncbi:hypothetical protein C7974DRAFT_290446, partial [Boeremia exigua]|uniref:uncharacterized protein n=1 Tax=Boeremia exigua TaxID=749465 RepID=UPI001E8ECA51